MDSYYDCPISETVDQLHLMMVEEHDKQIIKAVQQIGIQIDRDGLIAALRNDRDRYEAAYKKGYEDASQKYEARLKALRTMLGGSREDQDE